MPSRKGTKKENSVIIPITKQKMIELMLNPEFVQFQAKFVGLKQTIVQSQKAIIKTSEIIKEGEPKLTILRCLKQTPHIELPKIILWYLQNRQVEYEVEETIFIEEFRVKYVVVPPIFKDIIKISGELILTDHHESSTNEFEVGNEKLRSCKMTNQMSLFVDSYLCGELCERLIIEKLNQFNGVPESVQQWLADHNTTTNEVETKLVNIVEGRIDETLPMMISTMSIDDSKRQDEFDTEQLP